MTDHFCCDCPDDTILNDFANRKCRAVCTEDGGTTYECCHCPSGGCFSAKSTVKLDTGKEVTMSELQIGDKVQTGMGTANVTSIHS